MTTEEEPAVQTLHTTPRRWSIANAWQCRAALRLAGSRLGVVSAATLLLVSSIVGARAARLERLNSGRDDLAVFVIDGAFVGGETLTLQREISKLPANLPVAVVLNSPGGSLYEGLQLGEFFYRAKIATFVLGYGGGCFSACSLAFLGGRDVSTGGPSRTKMTGGRLGFHQFSTVRSDADKAKTFRKEDIDAEAKRVRAIAVVIIRYLVEIKEDMAKLHLMLKAPHDRVNIVSNEEALSLGIHVMGENAGEVIESAAIRARMGRQ